MGRKSQEQLDQEKVQQTTAMTQSPEFQDAVAKAVAAAVGPLMEKLAGARDGVGSEPQTGDRGLMQELAMAISMLTDQGSNRSRVAPEIIAQRQKAREEMVNLIIASRAEGRVATYQLRNKVVINEQLIEPFYVTSDHKSKPTEIDYGGVPNEAMVPVNDTAKEIFGAFMRSIGSVVAGRGKDGHVLPGQDRLGVTRGGLVVRNSAITNAVDRATPKIHDGPMPAYEEAPQTNGNPAYEPLRVNHKQEGGQYIEKHILGTIQPPARQTA